MTPTEIRDYVWEYLDLSAQDMSTALVMRWVTEGQREVLKSRPRWLHLEDRKVVVTVEGQVDYTIGDGITSIYSADCNETGPMAVMDEADAKAIYWQGEGLLVPTGRPAALSRWGVGTIRVWPIPDAVYTIQLMGQRPPVEPTATADLDLPSDLHDIVTDWVMSRAYMQQDDPDMATEHRKLFAAALERFGSVSDKDDDVRPMVFGGGPFQRRRAGSTTGLPPGPHINDPSWGGF